MSDEVKKNTGFAHDDDGNLDDRRIAGWVLIVAAVAMGIADLFEIMTANVEIVLGFITAGALLFGATVFEKFKRS
jgi:hypothetical protein